MPFPRPKLCYKSNNLLQFLPVHFFALWSMSPRGSWSAKNPWQISMSDTDHFDNPTRQIQGIQVQRGGEENNTVLIMFLVCIIYWRHLQGKSFKFW